MPKIHFSRHGFIACSQTKGRTTGVTSQVTCRSCQKTERFIQSDASQRLAAKAAFDAQVPRPFAEPWKQGNIVCDCGWDLFRYQGRSCMGHYDDYVCSNCGKISSRLTETGMSF